MAAFPERTVGVRVEFPEDIYEQLGRVAKHEERSRVAVVRYAVKKYVETAALRYITQSEPQPE